MALADLPTEMILNIFQRLHEEHVNALSQTNRRFYGILNEVLYRENIRHTLGSGAWRAVRYRSKAAILKFIAHGLDIRGSWVPLKEAVRRTLVDAGVISPDDKREEDEEQEVEEDEEPNRPHIYPSDSEDSEDSD